MDPNLRQYPIRYPDPFQIYTPTPANLYPSTFMQAPSFPNQVLVNFQGQDALQGLSQFRGPYMFPVQNIRRSRCDFPPVDYYNVLDPYQRSFLNYGYITKRNTSNCSNNGIPWG